MHYLSIGALSHLPFAHSPWLLVAAAVCLFLAWKSK